MAGSKLYYLPETNSKSTPDRPRFPKRKGSFPKSLIFQGRKLFVLGRDGTATAATVVLGPPFSWHFSAMPESLWLFMSLLIFGQHFNGKKDKRLAILCDLFGMVK